MSDTDDADDERREYLVAFEEETDEETAFDQVRHAYTGVDPNDEFQPVDEVELAEEELQLDDFDRTRDRSVDPDDVGWDLDAGDER